MIKKIVIGCLILTCFNFLSPVQAQDHQVVKNDAYFQVIETRKMRGYDDVLEYLEEDLSYDDEWWFLSLSGGISSFVLGNLDSMLGIFMNTSLAKEGTNGNWLSESFRAHDIEASRSTVKANDHFSEFILCFMLFFTLLIFYFPLKRMYMRNQIKKDVMKQRYVLKYQPIYDPRTHQVVGFESLVTCHDQRQEMISKLQKYDMLTYVVFWNMNQAIKDYHHLRLCHCVSKQNFYICVNVSLHQIKNKRFIDILIKKISQSHLDPQQICLGIGHRFKADDLEEMMNHIERLKQAGFMIMMNGFGIEYSNLELFHQLDMDIIKIDKLFVQGIANDLMKKEIILFISRLALIKQRAIILEGVEDIFEHQILLQIENVNLYVQGDYYSEPLFIEEILK